MRSATCAGCGTAEEILKTDGAWPDLPISYSSVTLATRGEPIINAVLCGACTRLIKHVLTRSGPS